MRDKSKQFSRLIKFIRTNKGISQLKISKALGYSSGQFISNIERDIAALPVTRLKALAKALDVDLKQLRKSYLESKLAKIKDKLAYGQKE